VRSPGGVSSLVALQSPVMGCGEYPPRFGTTILTAYPLVPSVMFSGRGTASPKAGDHFAQGRNHPPRTTWGPWPAHIAVWSVAVLKGEVSRPELGQE
jgi:hypothetical protein